jgi:molybdate transport system permease protein
MTWTEITPAEWEALRLSLRVATVAVLCSLPFALYVAALLARGNFPGRLLLDGLVHLPLVVPPVVIGYLLLVSFGKQGWLGAWLFDLFGLTIAFTWKGAALAAGIMAFPLMVRAMRLSLEAIDRRLETTARTLGAPPWRVYATITLPLMAPGILSGMVLAFARCLGEFGATITFVSNIPGETQTLPIAIYNALQIPGGELMAARLAGLSIVLALAALGFSELLARRSRARMAD